jgi:hypothetical protein
MRVKASPTLPHQWIAMRAAGQKVQDQTVLDPAEVLATSTPTPMSAAMGPQRDGGMPADRGVYAWWSGPGTLPDITGSRRTSDGKHELIYIGICPNKESGTRTMRDRLLRDHARRTRKSTLRRALASFLWEQARWGLATTADGRPTLDRRSEAELTAWMRRHLYLTWVSDPRPWDLEAGVIASLLSPLNSDMNSHHPLHSLVVSRREAWAAAARATSGSRG